MRHDGRQPNELRPLKIKRRYTRTAPGSVLISGRPHDGALLRRDRSGGARLDGRPGTRLADGRVQHVARQHQSPQAPRAGGESRRPDDGNPAPDRPQPPRRDRPGGHRRADGDHRLRRAGSRRRHPHAEHHRRFPRLGRCLAGGRQGPARRHPAASRQRGRRERGHGRRPAACWISATRKTSRRQST